MTSQEVLTATMDECEPLMESSFDHVALAADEAALTVLYMDLLALDANDDDEFDEAFTEVVVRSS